MAEATGGPAAGAHGATPPTGDALRKARTATSAALVRAAELVAPMCPPGEGPAHTPRVRLDRAARRRAGDNLAEELDDMLEDAAKREVTASGAEALLLTADIVRWLRDGGELPGRGAIELLEVHVAVFNDARHEEEVDLQRALLNVLFALVDAQAEAIFGGRWRLRRINVEAVEDRERRRFGANLDRLRESRGLTIGKLAREARLDVLTVVRLMFAAESAGSTEIRLLARALDVEPSALLPDPPGGAPSAAPAAAVAAVEDGPRGGDPNE
jgi:hypothetical protein